MNDMQYIPGKDLQYVRERVDSIAVTQAMHGVILEKNTESLVEHMRRTEALEKIIMDHDFLFKLVKFAIYGFGLIGTIAGAILAIRQLLM